MNGSWDAYLASLADFAGADDIITNLENETDTGDIECTPQSLIITRLQTFFSNSGSCCNDFESFGNDGKVKIPATSCTQLSPNWTQMRT